MTDHTKCGTLEQATNNDKRGKAQGHGKSPPGQRRAVKHSDMCGVVGRHRHPGADRIVPSSDRKGKRIHPTRFDKWKVGDRHAHSGRALAEKRPAPGMEVNGAPEPPQGLRRGGGDLRKQILPRTIDIHTRTGHGPPRAGGEEVS